MSTCKHSEFLQIFEIINGDKKTKEHVCENCLMIFKICLANESIAMTPEHEEKCPSCNSHKKRSKFRIVRDSWQEQLLEFSRREHTDTKLPKKRTAKS